MRADLLYRRVKSEEKKSGLIVVLPFLAKAYLSAVAEFVGAFGMHGLLPRMVYGQRNKEYDPLQDYVPPPPYYLWCRCFVPKPNGKDITKNMQRDGKNLLTPIEI